METIILAAGSIDYTHLPFGMHQSNATIPVNGRPVISWVLQDLLNKGYQKPIIVISDGNLRLYQFIKNYFKQKYDVRIVTVEDSKTIIHSLANGMSSLDYKTNKVQVILGDTLIKDNFDQCDNFVFAGQVASSEKWCTINTSTSGYLIELFDKEKIAGSNHKALCGYYRFNNAELLKSCVESCLLENKTELSSVLIKYSQKIPLKVILASEWFDFGHLDTLVESRKALIIPRHFNHICIDPILNLLTKTSQNSEKLEDELNWYKLLPKKLKALTPRVFSESETNGKISITQEYYGYPPLSELFLYADLDIGIWRSIIRYLFKIHDLFRNYKKPDKPIWRNLIYKLKTEERVSRLRKQDPIWDKLLGEEFIFINDKKYENIPLVWEKVQPAIRRIVENGEICIIHGDYCLSNILYGLSNQIVRLIDPRGSFGEKGIYGDPRYDIAKLRHSFVGLYDFIVSDLFYVNYDESFKFSYSMPLSPFIKEINKIFDEEVENSGYNVDEIRLIEGLLFLSMIAYHKDKKNRQVMMYIRAVEILNYVLP